MPAPYKTARELHAEATALEVDPTDHILNTADHYGWEDEMTLDAIRAVRDIDNTSKPHGMTFSEIVAVANTVDEDDPTPTAIVQAFEDAIQIDDLTDEQVEIVAHILAKL